MEGNMGKHVTMLSDVVMGSVKIFIGQYTPRIARTQKIMLSIILDVRYLLKFKNKFSRNILRKIDGNFVKKKCQKVQTGKV